MNPSAVYISTSFGVSFLNSSQSLFMNYYKFSDFYSRKNSKSDTEHLYSGTLVTEVMNLYKNFCLFKILLSLYLVSFAPISGGQTTKGNWTLSVFLSILKSSSYLLTSHDIQGVLTLKLKVCGVLNTAKRLYSGSESFTFKFSEKISVFESSFVA